MEQSHSLRTWISTLRGKIMKALADKISSIIISIITALDIIIIIYLQIVSLQTLITMIVKRKRKRKRKEKVLPIHLRINFLYAE